MKRAQDFRGKWYKSCSEMCRAYGINSSLLRKRMEAGWNLEEALTGDMHKVYDHTGIGYKSVEAMCRAWGVTSSVYRDRLNNGSTLEDALTRRTKSGYGCRKCIDTEGNEYRSISEMCREHGVNKSAYYSRIQSGCSIDEALTKGRLVRIKKDRYIDHEGNKYSSIKEMCSAWGISCGAYRYRVSKGMNIEQVLTSERYVRA